MRSPHLLSVPYHGSMPVKPARLAPGNYDLITAFAAAQRLVHNLQASFATYDSLYATFVASQENVPWPR